MLLMKGHLKGLLRYCSLARATFNPALWFPYKAQQKSYSDPVMLEIVLLDVNYLNLIVKLCAKLNTVCQPRWSELYLLSLFRIAPDVLFSIRIFFLKKKQELYALFFSFFTFSRDQLVTKCKEKIVIVFKNHGRFSLKDS